MAMIILNHLNQPNFKTFIADNLKKCLTLKTLESIYTTMIKFNGNQDCYLMNQFITACSSLRRTDYAILAFTQMIKPNVFVFNAMIRGFVQCGFAIRGLEFYMQMLRCHLLPTSYTFSALIKACSVVSEIGFGESVHGQIWKMGFEGHVFVQTGLIDFYSSSGRIVDSRKVFDEMSERDVFAMTTMVSAHARVGEMSLARALFEEMPERNVATWNIMIDGYARLKDAEVAEMLFHRMPVKDLISWTTMINCYAQKSQFKEALEVFNEMRSNGIAPDEMTMTTVISACAHLGALDLGKEVHLYVIQNGFDIDVYIGSALIDMYAKCGSLEKSLLVFYKLREKNLFCWNSIIEGLAVHGYAKEALNMFSKMVVENIQPNGITFISVLSACTHAGLVEEGRKRFRSMTRDFCIHPAIEHYGCMVDLLSKAGMLQDALELIENMKIATNSFIWGALLGGCKNYKNMKIAQIAIDKLKILEPNNSGHYTLSVNMYAEANRWHEVAEIRSDMKEVGVEKTCRGSSWIEMDRDIHQFAASDKSHSASGEIYMLLEQLDGQLRLAADIPKMSTIS